MFHRLLLAPLTVAIGLTWVHVTYAATMIVICSPPKGFAIHNELGKEVEVVEGGFPGVTPTFVLSDDKSEMAIVVFGSVPGVPPGRDDESVTKAKIVIWNEVQISMVNTIGDQVWIYSLYSKHGYGLFSYHGRGLPVLQNHVANGAMYQSKCQFAWK